MLHFGISSFLMFDKKTSTIGQTIATSHVFSAQKVAFWKGNPRQISNVCFNGRLQLLQFCGLNSSRRRRRNRGGFLPDVMTVKPVGTEFQQEMAKSK